MSAADRKLPAALLAATLAWCLALALLGAQDALPFLAPALLLAAPLARGRYLGEDVLDGLRAPPGLAPVLAPAPARPVLPARAGMPRGAQLIARSLAKRPPPRAAYA